MTLQDNRLFNRSSALRGGFLAALCLLTIGAALILGTASTRGHGNPEVKIDPNPAPFGGDVTIEGAGFEEEDAVSLVLEGVLGEVSLSSVTTDTEGMFSLTVTLPPGAAPGGYRIRAVGADDVAVADVRIQEGEGGAAPAAEHEGAVGFHAVDSAAEIAGFAGLAAALVLIGAALVWLPRERRHT